MFAELQEYIHTIKLKYNFKKKHKQPYKNFLSKLNYYDFLNKKNNSQNNLKEHIEQKFIDLYLLEETIFKMIDDQQFLFTLLNKDKHNSALKDFTQTIYHCDNIINNLIYSYNLFNIDLIEKTTTRIENIYDLFKNFLLINNEYIVNSLFKDNEFKKNFISIYLDIENLLNIGLILSFLKVIENNNALLNDKLKEKLELTIVDFISYFLNKKEQLYKSQNDKIYKSLNYFIAGSLYFYLGNESVAAKYIDIIINEQKTDNIKIPLLHASIYNFDEFIHFRKFIDQRISINNKKLYHITNDFLITENNLFL